MDLNNNFPTISFGEYKTLPAVSRTRPSPETEHARGCQEKLRTSPEAKTVFYAWILLALFLGFLIFPKFADAITTEDKGGLHQTAKTEDCDEQETDFPSETCEVNPEWWESYKMPDSAGESLSPEQQTLKNELGFFYDRDFYAALAQRLLGMDRIVIEDEMFLDAMLVIAAYLHKFQGKEIELSGFVYRDPAMSGNELALTRNMTTCCSAHATLYGTLVRGEGLDVFEDESWIRIRGLIDEDLIFQNMPVIIVLDAEAILPPDQSYVYPYLYRQHQP